MSDKVVCPECKEPLARLVVRTCTYLNCSLERGKLVTGESQHSTSVVYFCPLCYCEVADDEESATKVLSGRQ